MTNSAKVNLTGNEDQPGGHGFTLAVCPLCQEDKADDPLPVRDWEYGGPGLFSLARCCNCRLRYLKLRPTPAHMALYYPAYYVSYRTAIEDESWALMRWMRRRTIVRQRQVVERFSPPNANRILDIGCSTGIFLAEMKAAGWQTYGVELNREAAAYAQRRFGLDVQVGYLSETSWSPQTFEAVTMWDVLEHTFEPLETLQQVYQLLKPGGIVVCIVPNEHSLDRYLFGDAWVGYDAPRHLTVFSPETLERMVHTTGFQILRLRCGFGGYFSWATSLKIWLHRRQVSPWLRRALLGLVYLPGMRLPFEPYFKGLDRLGWGNELLVVARKPD